MVHLSNWCCGLNLFWFCSVCLRCFRRGLPALAHNGEKKRPRQQGVGVELACLGANRRTGTIHPCAGAGEQVLEALHGGMHILQQEAAVII
ncbi:hypothetical protein INR49_026597 [Caranx melampygus]|nr:hypothetical protein INR49_026597 [Caranx melampygus]